MECTKDSRRDLKTMEYKNIGDFTVAAICICMKVAVSSSLKNCQRILDRKHKSR